MRKCTTLRTWIVLLTLFHPAAKLGAQAAPQSEAPSQQPATAFSNAMLDRARTNLAHVQDLVSNGTLPPASLKEAQARFDDASDEVTLTETLYSPAPVGDLTADQQTHMLTAAQNRVDRQAAIVSERQKLLDMGIISKMEMQSINTEFETRRRVLDMAHDRIHLIELQRQMALDEKNLEHALEVAGSQKPMMKFNGRGHFVPRDLPAIASAFELEFHSPLPITANGQTLVHQALGLDHRGKFDIGLNPDLPAGAWLVRYLETHQIPFIAFRAAIPGAATAPHIHIGTGSSRLGAALRSTR